MNELPQNITDITVFDPGRTTGYAIWKRDEHTGKFYLWKYGTFPTWQRLEELIIATDCVVCEKVHQKVANFDDTGVGAMYVAQYIADKFKIPFHLQKPMMMKAPNLYAKEFLQHFPEHAGDAVAHGIAFIGITNITTMEEVQ